MNLYEILQNYGRVGEGMTHFERLFAQKVGGGKINKISGVPPLNYIGNGRPLTDYRIAGNTVQDGTPSADAPVDATGSGVRTGNLAPPLSEWEDGYITWTQGDVVRPDATQREKVTDFLPVPNGSIYLTFLGEDGTFATGINGGWRAIGFYDRDGAFISRSGGNGINAITATVPEGAAFMRVCCRTYGSDKNYMLNLGSEALPYEPYGYKLPPTVNGTEYPIYLGQVETTRRIKKLVLTGEEYWQLWNGNYYSSVIDRKGAISTILCTHFVNASGGITYSNQSSSGLKIANVAVPFVASVADLKAWLAAQYAAGTPVTVWYVIAEPETGIVNEPLMKIGDYADTISFAQAGVAIPTVNGTNVLDVPTEVKPSEVWIQGKIKEV